MERKLSRNKRKFSQLQAFTMQSETQESQIFVEAQDYPSFFNQNLIDPDRSIKIFYNQPYSHQTIFYFQLLRLVYQTEEVDYEKYLVKIYDLLDNPQFQFATPQQDSLCYLGVGEARMKRMIQQFLEQLGEGNIGVAEILTKYPVMDKLLIVFMRTILILGMKCSEFEDYIQPVEIYQFLADYFEVQITYYANCLRFNQSDLFVYFQAQNQIYLAYITPKGSQKNIGSSSQFYQADPEEAFNISSVKQMVSEIDIPIQQQCFNFSKQNQSLNQTEFVQYDYSQSQSLRRPSKSLQQNSDLKFSYLINDQSIILQNFNQIKSNRILQKQLVTQKKVPGRISKRQGECFEIKEVPLELQNAVSPVETPKVFRFASFGQEDAPYEKENVYNIYGKKDKKKQKVQDPIKQQSEMLSTGESDVGFRCKTVEAKDNWQLFKKQTEELFSDRPSQQVPASTKQQKTLKSLYDMRSIQSIISHNDSQSYVLDTPHKTSFNQSRKTTVQGFVKKNQYTKYGYVNNNLSNEFTSSLILQKMQEPFRNKIESIKKYQSSPKYTKEVEEESVVQPEQISIPAINLTANSIGDYGKSKSKDKHKRESLQKSSTIRIVPDKTNSDHEDEQQIFARCMNLTSRIQNLKQQKFEYAVQQFEEEQRKKMQFLLQKQKKLINHKFNEKKTELKGNYQKELAKITKGLDEIKKYKEAYLSMFQDLSQRRTKINNQYQTSVSKVRQAKEKIISEWKRSSNEQIIKKSSKTF